jgi:hypothetical protein
MGPDESPYEPALIGGKRPIPLTELKISWGKYLTYILLAVKEISHRERLWRCPEYQNVNIANPFTFFKTVPGLEPMTYGLGDS